MFEHSVHQGCSYAGSVSEFTSNATGLNISSIEKEIRISTERSVIDFNIYYIDITETLFQTNTKKYYLHKLTIQAAAINEKKCQCGSITYKKQPCLLRT